MQGGAEEARGVHSPEVAGSSPAPAPKTVIETPKGLAVVRVFVRGLGYEKALAEDGSVVDADDVRAVVAAMPETATGVPEKIGSVCYLRWVLYLRRREGSSAGQRAVIMLGMVPLGHMAASPSGFEVKSGRSA